MPGGLGVELVALFSFAGVTWTEADAAVGGSPIGARSSRGTCPLAGIPAVTGTLPGHAAASSSGTRPWALTVRGMHALMTDLIPLATDVQARGGILRGIGRLFLIGIVLLVLLGVFIGMKVSRRGR